MRLPRSLPIATALFFGTAAPAAADTLMSVQDFQFAPRVAPIAPGERVTFNFEGPSDHSATLRSGQTDRYDSGVVGAGTTKVRRFNHPGSFALFCTLHPEMTGRVTVGSRESTRPRVSRVRARGARGRVELVFRLSERSVVTAAVGRKRVRKLLNRGSRSLTVRGLRAGRHTARLGAKDGWGNRSAAVRRSFRAR
jgi:plastocyanin